MTVLDLETWSRREHFAFFRRSELPFYHVNTRVDVSGVRDEARRRACSLNDGLDLGFAHLAPGEDLFRTVFFSSLPWIAFTGVDHTLSLRRDDGIPRVTWGKITQDKGGRNWLPFNLQVNHMFVDGLHVGRFFDALDAEMKSFARAS